MNSANLYTNLIEYIFHTSVKLQIGTGSPSRRVPTATKFSASASIILRALEQNIFDFFCLLVFFWVFFVLFCFFVSCLF